MNNDDNDNDNDDAVVATTATTDGAQLMMLPSSEWVKRWWKWILETPASKNPAYGYRPDEQPHAETQPHNDENVWFLAGAFNNSGMMPRTHNQSYRSMYVPADKSLLLPVINYFRVEQSLKYADRLVSDVKQNIDDINPDTLFTEIDGQQIQGLSKYRKNTGDVFTITVESGDNVVNKKHLLGRKIKLWAFGDGYWLFLKPLSSAGEHKIHTFGSCLAGRIIVDINYKIYVTNDH